MKLVEGRRVGSCIAPTPGLDKQTEVKPVLHKRTGFALALLMLTCCAVAAMAQNQSRAFATQLQDQDLLLHSADLVGRVPHHPIRIERSTAPFGGYSPAAIRSAYEIDHFLVNGKPADGAGSTITIMSEGSPTIQQDLDAFSAHYGIPSTKLEMLYPDGQPNGFDQAGAFETTLDVELAHGIAPAAKIQLVVMKDLNFGSFLSAVKFAVENGARIVSISLGVPEWSGQISYDQYFDPTKASFLASSGDSGNVYFTWPATSPGVTAVGGTSLNPHVGRAGRSEVGWSGSGGGLSSYEFDLSQAFIKKTVRKIPDVSFNSDPETGYAIVYSFLDGKTYYWVRAGGTSAAAPAWAGIIALANSARAPNNPITNLNTLLYKLYSDGHDIFNDIVSGCNGPNSCAGPGYDLVTGLGSPKGLNLLIALSQAP